MHKPLSLNLPDCFEVCFLFYTHGYGRMQGLNWYMWSTHKSFKTCCDINERIVSKNSVLKPLLTAPGEESCRIVLMDMANARPF